jgi:hypothetical protein
MAHWHDMITELRCGSHEGFLAMATNSRKWSDSVNTAARGMRMDINMAARFVNVA